MTDETKISIIDKLNDMETERFVTLVISSVLLLFMLMITTCSIHMNMSNPIDAKVAVAEANAEIKIMDAKARVDIELAKQQYSEAMAQIKAIENLVKTSGTNPIAARCAIEGWRGSNTMTSVCRITLTEKNQPNDEITGLPEEESK